MALINSISGFRGTIGGKKGESLTPIDIAEATAAFSSMVIDSGKPKKVVIGRDGRMTGELVSAIVASTLMSMGLDVVDLGLSTTPTVEMAVSKLGAGAGIIITASHNPRNWNALKFLDHNGEIIAETTLKKVIANMENGQAVFAEPDHIGSYEYRNDMIAWHIGKILELPYISEKEIIDREFTVVVDCINSTGALSVTPLLKKLGCKIISLNDEVTGDFAHDPEPLPHNLKQLSSAVIENSADLGIAVDPDVDRLAFVCHDGSMFGEEYTLVAAADHVLARKKGSTVSNMSSSRALRDITHRHGCDYYPAKVGELNVVEKMKEVNAVIGGEGNGGVILPDLHFGRDALAGIALVLSLIAERNISLRSLRDSYPDYAFSKNKLDIPAGHDPEEIYKALAKKYKDEEINTEDGLKIDFADSWVHLRKSNTEPILRVYAESTSEQKAAELAQMLIEDVKVIKQINSSM
jgi:phosphomannomutase